MDEELKTLLKSIKSQTNIDIFVYSFESGAKFSTSDEDFSMPSVRDFDGVFADEESKKTYFKLNYKQMPLLFYIDGAGMSEQIYAKFISNLIENYSDKELVLSRQEYLKAILLGECSKSQVNKYIQKFSAPDCSSYAIIIECDEKKASECYSIIENYTVDSFDACTVTGKNCITYVRFLNNFEDEYGSKTEFCQFLQRIIYEEGGGDSAFYVGGTVGSFDMIRTSYAQAEATLEIVKKSHSEKKINLYSDHVFTKLLEDVSKERASEYLNVFAEGNFFDVLNDKELLLTAQAFIDYDLNACSTAKNLYIHRNTLNYRLDKIKRQTGLDIRRFSDAFTFRIIMLLLNVKD